MLFLPLKILIFKIHSFLGMTRVRDNKTMQLTFVSLFYLVSKIRFPPLTYVGNNISRISSEIVRQALPRWSNRRELIRTVLQCSTK